MWNLQFGRFALLDGKPDVDKLVNLMSVMLNAKMIPVDEQSLLNSDFTLKISGEDFKELQMDFYEEKEAFGVKYKFDENIRSEILREFAKKVSSNVYRISKDDVEKIKNAVKSR
jgi:hypothetical protein